MLHSTLQGVGIGLKPQHFQALLDQRPEIDFLEVHAENYLVPGGPFHHYLTELAQHYDVSIHGVALSIGGHDPLDTQHLQAVRALLDRYRPASFSEHLAWSSHQGSYFNDLLPIAYTTDTLTRVCEHMDQAQTALGRCILLENPSTYLTYNGSTYAEPDFLAEVVRRTGCGVLLDVNNVFVSCTNHHWDAMAYLKALPLHRVGQIHLAGFARQTDAAGAPLLIDHHGAAVDEAVWSLYRCALDLMQAPAPATLIEWDNDVPALPELLAQAWQARDLMQGRSMP